MDILIVCSGNNGNLSPFIEEQISALSCLGIRIHLYMIIGKGIKGYLSNLPKIIRKISSTNIDLIHAHYGLSGLLAGLQFKKKLIITFHGSDVHIFWVRLLSRIASLRASEKIFVSDKLAIKLGIKKYHLIPCGVNLKIFFPIEKSEARKKLRMSLTKKYILFSSSFSNAVKNFQLAEKSLKIINDQEIQLIELKGYSREQVNLLINACDIALLTSISEGSPQFIKEAMACNCPIVSTDVGDVRWVLGNTEGCYITSFNPDDVAEKIHQALKFAETVGRTNGRERIIELGLDSESVARRIINVYKGVLNI